MDIKYTFEKGAKPDELWGTWRGRFTVGYIGCRGTRVWFRANAASTFDAEFDSDSEAEEIKEWREDLEQEDCIFPGDYGNLRAESLEEILEELEGKVEHPQMFKYVQGPVEKLVQELWGDNYHLAILLENEHTTDPILIDLWPTRDVWFLHKKDAILEELRTVLKVCNEKGVTWIWV